MEEYLYHVTYPIMDVMLPTPLEQNDRQAPVLIRVITVMIKIVLYYLDRSRPFLLRKKNKMMKL